MKKITGAHWIKRVLSVVLALGMVVTTLTVADLAKIVNAAETNATGDETTLYGERLKGMRTRAVLDELPIPADKRSGSAYNEWLVDWHASIKGTMDRPFVILELVPYYEQASFGWLIEGCEPIDMERVKGNSSIMSSINYLGTSSKFFNTKLVDYVTYFFPDEEEGKRGFYTEKKNVGGTDVMTYKFSETQWESSAMSLTDGTEIDGYWETVEPGKGTHRIAVADGADGDGMKHIVPANNAVAGEEGTLVWHTTENQFTKDRWDQIGYSLPDKFYTFETIEANDGNDDNVDWLIGYLKLDQVGARYHTSRIASSSDPCMKIPANSFYTYESNDLFVRDTLGKSLKYDSSNPNSSCQEYSVWIKTITPKELNENPQWVDIADLMFVTRYNQDEPIAALHKEKDAAGKLYNRLNRSPLAKAFNQENSAFGGSYDSTDYAGYSGKRRDISWSVASKIFERVAAARNFMGIVFDYTIRNNSKFADKKSVKYYKYDLNDHRLKTADGTKDDSFDQEGYKDNLYKLWMMCTSTKPNMVERFYIKTGKIVEDANGYGVFKDGLNRSKDEREYWSGPSFYYAASVYPDVNLERVDEDTHYWEDYSGMFNQKLYVSYVQGHTYTYNGNQSIYAGYHNGAVNATPVGHFADYGNYLNTNATTQAIWEQYYSGSYSNVNTNTAPPWTAIRYILELDREDSPFVEDMYVLDIEPSVALGTDRKPAWSLDDNDIALMVPSLTSGATITYNHMLSNSFIGRNEDMNSTYDLVYIGDDAAGFWSGNDVDKWSKTNTNWKNSTAAAGKDRTDFYDDDMDGLLYFHIGDYYTAWKDAKPDFIYNVDEGKYIYTPGNNHTYNTGNTVRQPGNDFTSIKVKELKSYIKAGYPVAVAKNLYADSSVKPYVGSDTLIKGFLTDSKASRNADGTYTDGVLRNDEVAGIDARVRLRKNTQIFIDDSTPKRYNSADKENSYLPKEGVYGKLLFKVDVPNTTDYSYRIYLDQDRNGKFSSGEIVQTNQLTSKHSELTTYVTDGWVGFIQWRIEVYKTTNDNLRVSSSGCSAIKAKETEKNKILALQIVPNNDSDVHLKTHNGNGTEASNASWKNLYNFCTDFEIEVYEIKFQDFEKFFRKGVNGDGDGYGFTYDMSKDINVSDTEILSNTNPRRDIVELVEKQTEHEKLKNTYLGGHTLSEFNMIVIGFKDSYGNQDFRNKYGCAEYLFYFADKGKSILFTHDLAHYRNAVDWSIGASATTMLRDIMGMNRYGMVSYRLVNDTTEDHNFNPGGGVSTLGKNLAAYNVKKGIPYETTTSVYKHGYTFANLMSKVGQSGGNNRRSQYKYVCINPANGNNVSVGSGGSIGNNLASTDRVVRLNEGQITQYPFNIDKTLAVNTTHYQYYQLNMEDPELTVWFTLEDPKVNGSSSGGNNELIYGVTPQDPANNYYIYSKGNIFYSGVGHSGISNDPERKLFVNTLIAAYRPTLQEPEIIVTNTEAVRNGKQYTIRVDQEFDYDDSDNRISPDALTGEIEVFFLPRDYSGAPTLKVRIYYEGESQFFGDDAGFYIYKAKLDADGNKVRGDRVTTKVAGVDNTYLLNTEQEYVIVYQKSRLHTGDANNHIIFEAKNDRVEAPSKTDLYFKPRPLFILD